MSHDKISLVDARDAYDAFKEARGEFLVDALKSLSKAFQDARKESTLRDAATMFRLHLGDFAANLRRAFNLPVRTKKIELNRVKIQALDNLRIAEENDRLRQATQVRQDDVIGNFFNDFLHGKVTENTSMFHPVAEGRYDCFKRTIARERKATTKIH